MHTGHQAIENNWTMKTKVLVAVLCEKVTLVRPRYKHAMRIYGLDFTSAPSSELSKAKRCKRLMLASCSFRDNILHVEELRSLNGNKQGDFSIFEKWLNTKGEWIAGIDFPFGQPAKLIDDLSWPKTWADYVGYVNILGKKSFEEDLKQYKEKKPIGQKEYRRETDHRARAISPMKLYGVPVGKMFFQGAIRLLHSECSIHPVRIVNHEKRHVIEAYPAMVARTCFSSPSSYKSDDPKRNTDNVLKESRERIIKTISANNSSDLFMKTYGFMVEMSVNDKNICINDPSGDYLDSVLCAIQAAWSYTRKNSNYGIPEKASILEGWICDPQNLEGTD